MKTDIFNHFEALRADSRVRVSQPVIHGFHEISNSKGEAGKELIKAELVANGQWRWRLEGGSQAIRDKSAHSSWRKVKEFSEFDEGAHIERLNAALQGGEKLSYSVTAIWCNNRSSVGRNGSALFCGIDRR